MKKFIYTMSVVIITLGLVRLYDAFISHAHINDIWFYIIVIISGIFLGMIEIH